MAGLSEIEWTDATWNPVSGCVMVSPGCTNCYAMRMAARLQAMEHPGYAAVTRKSGGRPVWTGSLHLNDAALEIPLRWRSPRRIFVNSMSDLFQDGVPGEFIRRVWNVMGRAKLAHLSDPHQTTREYACCREERTLATLPNVWLGTSVESFDYTDRIEVLRKVPAAVRFVSFEPLLGPVGRIELHEYPLGHCRRRVRSFCKADGRKMGDARFSRCATGRALPSSSSNGAAPTRRRSGRLLQGRTWDEYPETALLAAE